MPDSERRGYVRFSSKGSFLIYKPVSIIAYTVDLKNISRTGAFITTNHFPPIGEEVNFDILNSYGVKIAAGHGRVARIIREGTESASGFGVQFSQKLPKELEAILVDEKSLSQG